MADPQLPENWKRVRSAIYAKAAPTIKLRDRVVERMMGRVRAVADWLEPADTPVLRSYCELEILARQAYGTLRATGILSAKTGEGKRLLSDYRLLRQTQVGIAMQLGLTPATRQALRANRGAAVDAVGAMIDTEPAQEAESDAEPSRVLQGFRPDEERKP